MLKWLIVVLMALGLLAMVGASLNSCQTNKELVSEKEVEKIINILNEAETPFIEPDLGYNLFYGDFSEIEKIAQIPKWIMDHFPHVPGRSWNSPEQIIRNGYVNFNDFTILLINIAKVRFDVELDLVIMDTRDVILDYGQDNQAMIGYKGKIYVAFDIRYQIDKKPKYFYPFNKVIDTDNIIRRGII